MSADISHIGALVETEAVIPQVPAVISYAGILLEGEFIPPLLKAKTESSSILSTKPFLKDLQFSKLLAFMPSPTISNIGISHPDEQNSLSPNFANPIQLDRFFGEDPDKISVSFQSDFQANDLITNTSYSVQSAYVAEKPLLSYL